MKTVKMKYINVVGAFALVCATTALANCLAPNDIDEVGSCGGTPQDPTYPNCQQITYAPANRSECDPSPTGTYDCQNVIVHVLKTTSNYLALGPVLGQPGMPTSCSWMLLDPVTTVDTGQLCLTTNQGTDTCP